jgi:hypothetical protein
VGAGEGRPARGDDVGALLSLLDHLEMPERSQQPGEGTRITRGRLGQPRGGARLGEQVEELQPAAGAQGHRDPRPPDHPDDICDRVLVHGRTSRGPPQDVTRRSCPAIGSQSPTLSSVDDRPQSDQASRARHSTSRAGHDDTGTPSRHVTTRRHIGVSLRRLGVTSVSLCADSASHDAGWAAVAGPPPRGRDLGDAQSRVACSVIGTPS